MVHIRRSRYSPLAIPLFRLSVKNLLSKLRVRDRATVGVKIGLGLTDCRIRGKLRQFLVSSFFHFFCAHTRVNTERRGLISSLWAGCDAEMAFWGIFLRGNVRRFFWETYGKIPGGGALCGGISRVNLSLRIYSGEMLRGGLSGVVVRIPMQDYYVSTCSGIIWDTLVNTQTRTHTDRQLLNGCISGPAN